MPVNLYDRSALRAAAARKGDTNANKMAARLRCSRETAYRLWRGEGEPSLRLANKVYDAYRVKGADLRRPRPAVDPEPVTDAEPAA